MRIISLCVDGIHQAAQRGLYDWLNSQDADIICLQNLKALEYELDEELFHPQGYNAYFFDSGEKHCNGVAIYTRKQPKALIFGLGFASGVDMQGRYLQADFEHISVGSLLAPTFDGSAESEQVKIKFFDDFQAHLNKISRKRREYIFCGNWAMAHTAKDVQNADTHNDEPGFLAHEQQWMDQLFNQLEYKDAFRRVVGDGDEYTWWPSGKTGQGDGWRVDYQVVSDPLAANIEHGAIYKNQVFSSHLPLIMDYDIEL